MDLRGGGGIFSTQTPSNLLMNVREIYIKNLNLLTQGKKKFKTTSTTKS